MALENKKLDIPMKKMLASTYRILTIKTLRRYTKNQNSQGKDQFIKHLILK